MYTLPPLYQVLLVLSAVIFIYFCSSRIFDKQFCYKFLKHYFFVALSRPKIINPKIDITCNTTTRRSTHGGSSSPKTIQIDRAARRILPDTHEKRRPYLWKLARLLILKAQSRICWAVVKQQQQQFAHSDIKLETRWETTGVYYYL